MRLIDADALMKSMYHRAFETDGDTMWQSGCWVRYRAIEQVVKEQPTVDTHPVRHGHWTLQEDRTKKLYGWHFCSECGAWIGEPTNYCSNCGADMRGKQNETD